MITPATAAEAEVHLLLLDKSKKTIQKYNDYCKNKN